MMTSVPFLKLYTDYVTNLNAASQLVESWVEKNKRFAALVKDIKAQTVLDFICLHLVAFSAALSYEVIEFSSR